MRKFLLSQVPTDAKLANVLADLLLRGIVWNSRPPPPSRFCYRQWIELRLKDLWLQGSRLEDRAVEPLRTHDLRVLWRHVRPLVEAAWQQGDPKELDRLQRVIEELAAFDGPQGTGFRYALDKEGRESLPDDLQINLHDVRAVMGRVALLLDGAAEGLAVMLEQEAEMREWYGGE